MLKYFGHKLNLIFIFAILSLVSTPSRATTPSPSLSTPAAPLINAQGYVLMDAHSGKILASRNLDQRLAPASLTKMMTSYVISAAIREGRIHLDDLAPISEAAWRTGGSKMFVKVGTQVKVSDLMQGIIVDSGNDACIAMAEYVAGSQDSFVNLMNQQANRMGLLNTHFMNVDGLPAPNHYTSPRDMAILGRALIFDFPEDYKWYSQKWFTYNGIRQPNRNRLLWRDLNVDGIKTGHTDEAGFCLVASAVNEGMRLISVVMGAPTEAARVDSNQKLLTYGFHFFKTHKLYSANTLVTSARVWSGAESTLPIGLKHDFYVTIPTGQYSHLAAHMTLSSPLQAPIQKGQVVGRLLVTLNGAQIATEPLVALQEDPLGGFWRRLTDRIRFYFS